LRTGGTQKIRNARSTLRRGKGVVPLGETGKDLKEGKRFIAPKWRKKRKRVIGKEYGTATKRNKLGRKKEPMFQYTKEEGGLRKRSGGGEGGQSVSAGPKPTGAPEERLWGGEPMDLMNWKGKRLPGKTKGKRWKNNKESCLKGEKNRTGNPIKEKIPRGTEKRAWGQNTKKGKCSGHP